MGRAKVSNTYVFSNRMGEVFGSTMLLRGTPPSYLSVIWWAAARDVSKTTRRTGSERPKLLTNNRGRRIQNYVYESPNPCFNTPSYVWELS